MHDTMICSTMSYTKPQPFTIQRHATLLGTGSGMPDNVLTNQDIIDSCDLIASDRAVQFSLGISERRRAKKDVPVSEYLYRAAKMAIDNAGIDPNKIDRIIYSRLFGETSIPATSLSVLEKLGISRGIPVMDISAACSGFLHGTDLALNCINSGDDYVLVLGGDRGGIDLDYDVVKDTRTIFLGGDGFAAALYGHSEEQKFQARYFYTDSSLFDFASIPFGTELLNKTESFDKEIFNLSMPDGEKIHKSVLDSCRIISDRLLAVAEMTMDDVDFFITSDQTALVWKDQVKILGLSEEQSVSCFHKYGNTVAAMVPLNLHEAISTGKLKRGMRVLLMGHGAGASGGGFLFTY